MKSAATETTIHALSNLMKTSSQRPFAVFATLRFIFFPSASRAAGDKWAGPAVQPYLFSAKRLRVLRASAFLFIPTPHPLFLCVLGVLAVPLLLPASASTTWNGPTWTVSTAIPDNDEVGFTDIRMVTIPAITEIESLTVNLNFSGGWNGDLYAYLVHGSGFSVLLNRPGRSLANPDGSATVGMAVTFNDAAVSDIHTGIPMSGGSLTGTWQPDGRITDPYNTLNTDARPAMLADFIGLDPNGTWKLFVADQSAGETSTLQSWSLTITAVPELSSVMLAALGLFPLFRRKRVCSH